MPGHPTLKAMAHKIAAVRTASTMDQPRTRHTERRSFDRAGTTGEIPAVRLEKALEEGAALFRPFKVPFPYESTHDVFCLRDSRITNSYRKISLNGIELRVPGVDPHEKVDLRMIPDSEKGLTEIRFWHNGKLVSTQKIKTSSLIPVRF
jgi:hypothetical protein